MMISPEAYYEFELKEKSAEQIFSAIKRLKREIASLKRTMEHPNYAPTMCPSEDTRLWCAREYLERAKLALVEVGGGYLPSKAELRTQQFENNIPYINRIDLSIGGFFATWIKYSAVIVGNTVRFAMNDGLIPTPVELGVESDVTFTKGEFLEGIRELHIGEWRKNYDLRRFGYEVCDGTQWELKIKFSNGHKPIEIYGDNAYPYNFKELKELLGIDDECEQE